MVSRDLVVIAYQSGSPGEPQIVLWLVFGGCQNPGQLWLCIIPYVAKEAPTNGKEKLTPARIFLRSAEHDVLKLSEAIDCVVRRHTTVFVLQIFLALHIFVRPMGNSN
jgi:hypothetical protein